MIEFVVHIPINVRVFVLDYLRKSVKNIEKSIGEEIVVDTPPHDHSRDWIKERYQENRLPDLILAHSTDFALTAAEKNVDLFESIGTDFYRDFPIRPELEVLNDPSGIFCPVFAVPLVMFFNKENVDLNRLDGTWSDLLNEELSVASPDRDTPISKAVRAHIKSQYPDRYEAFEKSIHYFDSPVQAVNAVVSGKCQMGISNATFPRTVELKGIVINYPREGVVPIPNLLVMKKGAHSETARIASLLLDSELQSYIGKQGFWPVRGDATIDKSITYDGLLKVWPGWNPFMESIASLSAKNQGE